MGLVTPHRSTDTYSMPPHVEAWITKKVRKSEHQLWRDVANMAKSSAALQIGDSEKVSSTVVSC